MNTLTNLLIYKKKASSTTAEGFPAGGNMNSFPTAGVSSFVQIPAYSYHC
jgi:hypothetical protein